jgi:uncharacterized damage-inducible protein DinB
MKRLLLLLALVPAPAFAQDGATPTTSVGLVGTVYSQGFAYVLAAAEQMPEADYGFKPTPEVRSFGQLLGHVANAQFAFCSSVLGEASPATQNYEQVTEKAALIQALRTSDELCQRAYAETDDAEGMQNARIFGQERPRLVWLTINASHGFEHYGNLVTYMRLKGMVPPSSQGG